MPFHQTFHTPAFIQGSVKGFIAQLYDRRITHIDEVIKKLKFKTETHSSSAQQDDDAEQKFTKLLKRYLCGTGHVKHPWVYAIVDQAARDAVANDPLFRVKALMMCMTGADVRPLENYWTLQVGTSQRMVYCGLADPLTVYV